MVFPYYFLIIDSHGTITVEWADQQSRNLAGPAERIVHIEFVVVVAVLGGVVVVIVVKAAVVGAAVGFVEVVVTVVTVNSSGTLAFEHFRQYCLDWKEYDLIGLYLESF